MVSGFNSHLLTRADKEGPGIAEMGWSRQLGKYHFRICRLPSSKVQEVDPRETQKKMDRQKCRWPALPTKGLFFQDCPERSVVVPETEAWVGQGSHGGPRSRGGGLATERGRGPDQGLGYPVSMGRLPVARACVPSCLAQSLEGEGRTILATLESPCSWILLNFQKKSRLW